MRVLVALGGNALLPRGAPPDAGVQVDHIEAVAPVLADLARVHDLVITHGNGPQVGMLALESDADAQLTRPYPFDALVAETQGMIGYWLQREVAAAGYDGPVVTVVTQTVVDPADPAFSAPTKFVGATYDEATVRGLADERGWTIARDGDRWRRTVPSPAPQRVVEVPIIAQLVEAGVTVICAGGGGCPVVVTASGLEGVEAVVDKDLVACRLATDLSADLLVMATDVAGVYRDFGTPDAELLGSVTVAEVAAMALPAGSMGPKVEAACRFVKDTGHRAAIGALDDLPHLVDGTRGTQVQV
jgi:carbamate kinase